MKTSIDHAGSRPKILYVAGRELTYSRNDVIVRALRRNGFEVDSVGNIQPVRSITRTSLALNLRIAAKLHRNRYQLIVIGFYGYLIVPFVRALTRTPILFDAFISNYDTLCFDRQIIPPASLQGKLLYQFDRQIARMADLVLLDTPYHVDYFADVFGLRREQMSWVPVGCNENIFHKQAGTKRSDRFVVLQYSTYLQLHGVDVILQAAHRLQEYPIRFRLIGDGPLYGKMREMAETLTLTNVEFLPSVRLPDLANEITGAHICLGGHFGTSEKSQRVVPGKIYQMMAMGSAIIAADSHANRSLLVHQQSALLVPARDPGSLANAIQMLYQYPDLRDALALAARERYESTSSETMIAAKLHEIISVLTQKNPVAHSQTHQ